jgi:hypothetical protein
MPPGFVKARLFLQAIRMSIQDKYRTSQDYREILRILQKSANFQGNLIWQSDASVKSVIPIHHFEIDFVSREVVINFDTQKFKIKHHLPLYVKLDYKTTVFKVTEYNSNHQSVTFIFPKEIKTLELRSSTRYPVAQKDFSVALRPNLNGLRDVLPELKLSVLDVSENGLGLIVSEQNRSFLKNNRILWVTELGGHRLDHPVLGEVAYINNDLDSRLQTRKIKELKVGLKLSDYLRSDLFQKLLQ